VPLVNGVVVNDALFHSVPHVNDRMTDCTVAFKKSNHLTSPVRRITVLLKYEELAGDVTSVRQHAAKRHGSRLHSP